MTKYTYSILGFIYLILMLHLPVGIFANAMHDDALFFHRGMDLLSGHWLGSFNNLTLAKGMGFPLILAINSFIGLPITLFLAILYLAASIFFIEKLKYFCDKKVVLMIIFSLILFHPSLFPIRIIRDNIYPALTLLIIGIFIELIYRNEEMPFIKAAIYGFIFFIFITTRDESIWVFPGFLVIFIGFITNNKNKIKIFTFAKSFFKITFFTFTFITLISLVNYIKYGKFQYNDFSSGPFKSAVTKLSNINVDNPAPFFPVQYEKRQLIYAVSPSFSLLENYFEGPGRAWTKHGCDIYPNRCEDYAAGWFMWALRDAVASIGLYSSPINAAKFYAQLVSELEEACAAKKLNCDIGLIPFLPQISKGQWADLPRVIYEAVKLSVVDWVEVESSPSVDLGDSLPGILLFLGNPLITPTTLDKKISINGWYYSSTNDWIYIDCLDNDGNSLKYSVARLQSPDIALKYNSKEFSKSRFSVNNIPAGCFFRNKNSKLNISIDSIKKNKDLNYSFSSLDNLHIDNINFSNGKNIYKLPIKIKYYIADLYKILAPTIAIIGLICLFLNLFLHKYMMKNKILAYVVYGIYAMYISRLFILSIITISSFTAIIPIYISSCFILIFIASVLSIYLCIENFMHMKNSKRKLA